MRRQAREGKKDQGMMVQAWKPFCSFVSKSHPYKSMWQDVGCHLHISSVRGVLSRKVEGKAWPDEEKE